MTLDDIRADLAERQRQAESDKAATLHRMQERMQAQQQDQDRLARLEIALAEVRGGLAALERVNG